MFRSATLRLTLSYLAIVMAISVLFSIALYNVTTNELNRGLRSESQSIFNQFPVFQGDPTLNLQPGSYYQASAHRIILRLVGFNVLVLVSAGVTSYWLARRTLEPIEIAHEQQKRFTSDASHELRTPLTVIKMESEVALLNKKLSSVDLRNILTSNLEEVSKLEALINNLLRLSRLEVDELQQNFNQIKSDDIVNSAIEEVDKIASQHNIKITKTGKNHTIIGDNASLKQLLVILLDNAIKYSPNGTNVSLETHISKNHFMWRIIDEGSGIEPEALQHVFDRFYRADSSRNKTGSEGYGLGLSIAKMIADIHAGTITLKSKVSHGTTVTVSLPKT